MAYFPNDSQNSIDNIGQNKNSSRDIPAENQQKAEYQNRKMSKTVSKEDLYAIESEILKLLGIEAARIIVDEQNYPIEIHVVASSNKTPKQIAKDVQSIILANFYISVDYRIISVVQIQTNNTQSDQPKTYEKLNERAVIERVTVEKASNFSLARVTLRQGDYVSEGFAKGTAASATRHRLVAMATLDSLKQINDIESELEVVSAEIISSQEYQIAVVVIMLVNGNNEESLAGSALVNEEDFSTSIAKAVLSATNRRLALQNT